MAGQNSAEPPRAASPLFLREAEIRRGVELLYFGYSHLTRAIDEGLARQGLGRAHHRALYFIARQPDLMDSCAQMLEQGGGVANVHTVSGAESLSPVEEDPRMSTNEAAQTGLTCIEVLELCKDVLPTEAAVRRVRQRRPPVAPAGAR